MYINSSIALVIYSGIMVGAYLFSTWLTDAPFLAFASQFTIGFVAYLTKRIVQKQAKYGVNNFKSG